MNATRMTSILAGARALGPYVLVELLLPGGTLIALALWLARQSRRQAGNPLPLTSGQQ